MNSDVTAEQAVALATDALLRKALSLISDQSAREFWMQTYKNGLMDLQDIANELSDYHMIMINASLVYEEVTGGNMSKPNYLASSVISEYHNHLQDLAESDRQDFMQEFEDKAVQPIEIELDDDTSGIIEQCMLCGANADQQELIEHYQTCPLHGIRRGLDDLLEDKPKPN